MINICFITDDNYILPTLTAIQSVKENVARKTCIYVLSDSLSSDKIELLNQMSTNKTQINFIRVDDNPCSSIDTSHAYVSKTAMIKFLLPQILKDLDKVLYIDGDILVLKDIKEMYETDISDSYAAVVPDFTAIVKHKHHLDLNLNTYFNSGMMLLNLEKMRNDNITDKLIENKLNDKFKIYMDQDALNITFSNKITLLSPTYNLMKANLNYSIQELSLFFNINVSDMHKIIKQPVILHLTNIVKPWNSVDAPCFKDWYSYLKQLPDFSLKSKKIKELNSQIHKKQRQFVKKLLNLVFSSKNEGTRKVVTILGIKFKLKNEKLIQKERFRILEDKLDKLTSDVRELAQLVKEKK